MSRVTRRKHVVKEMMKDGYDLPKGKQQIVKVICCRGNNLHEVETANTDAEHFLVSMPMKFRRNIWIKRGDYILVEPIEDGRKVKGEICKILTPEHITEYTKANVWPERFVKKSNQYCNESIKTKSVESDSESDGIEPNINRPILIRNFKDDSEDDEEYTSSEEDY